MVKTFLISSLLIFAFGSFNVQAKTIKDFFKGKTNLGNLSNIRDPFRSPLKRKLKSSDAKGKTKKTYLIDGKYTNISRPSLSSINIDELIITGVVIGKNRRAIAKTLNGKTTITLKEGMILGADKLELKAILPGGIVFVERIVNVYGQEEYLETVIPLSQ
jgi:hypothetical protein